MPSVSLFEQLTSSVSLSVLGIVSGAILVLLLVYTVSCRLFFSSSSSSKSKDISSSKEKKSTTKKQQNDTTTSNTKKNVKVKKPVVAVSSSSPSTQSEEIENDTETLVASTKKSTPPPNKALTKQQGPVRAENAEEKKPSKVGTSNKQQTSGKGDVTTKINATNSNKKQSVDGEGGNDQEDEGQWVTQGSKQVNNRDRNKGKAEPNRNIVAEKRPVVPTTNENESDIESTTPLIQHQEPIEICQLLPKTENRYTANDNWWKQALNKQQTFSIDDLGEWPEHEQDEQYIVQKKRIVPIKKSNEQHDGNEL